MSRPNNLIELYLSQIIKNENNCWFLPIKPERNGYIRVRCNGQRELAHRLFYRHFKGPFAYYLTIDHLCGIRNCVNPEHLEVVTLAENTRRRNLTKPTKRCEVTGKFKGA